MWQLLTIGVVLVLTACGSDAAETEPPSSDSGSWDDFCDARAKLGCTGFDAAACKEQQACASALVRDEGEAQLLECLREECDWDLEGGCMSELTAVPMSAAAQAFQEACSLRATECSISDDACFSGFVVADEGIAELDACLDEATCDETDACLEGWFATDFEGCSSWL